MPSEQTTIEDRIDAYIGSQSETKRQEMIALHERILREGHGCKLWFSDGKNEAGKVVTNPSIGYGSYTIKYANGTSREFYRIGLSANTSGISVYVLGLADKTYLASAFGKTLGKASVSGYCIKFKRLGDIDLPTLMAAVRYGFESPSD